MTEDRNPVIERLAQAGGNLWECQERRLTDPAHDAACTSATVASSGAEDLVLPHVMFQWIAEASPRFGITLARLRMLWIGGRKSKDH